MLRRLSLSAIRKKRVLLRVDFNVPIAGRQAPLEARRRRRLPRLGRGPLAGQVQDEYDILRVLPTIRRLVRQENILVLLAHHSNDRQSLAPLVSVLARRLKQPVAFIKNPLSIRARILVERARPGAVFLAENLRFWPGEKNNSPKFSRAIARLGQFFVNDAFGELHRPYASMVGLPHLLPSLAGPLIKSELKMLDKFFNHPRRPLVAIFGGAKIKTKLAILRRFIRLADKVLVGGALADVLLRARGFKLGRSRRESRIAAVGSLARSRKLILPADAVVESGRRRRIVPVSGVAAGDAIYDLGPRTRRLFIASIRQARTIVWNGPLGLVENEKYSRGTMAIARALAQKPTSVLVGGGDTAAYLKRARLLKKFKYVSTGGGAMLAYLAGEQLPGLEALKHSKK